MMIFSCLTIIRMESSLVFLKPSESRRLTRLELDMKTYSLFHSHPLVKLDFAIHSFECVLCAIAINSLPFSLIALLLQNSTLLPSKSHKARPTQVHYDN